MSNLKDAIKIGGAAVGLGAVALFYYLATEKTTKKPHSISSFDNDQDHTKNIQNDQFTPSVSVHHSQEPACTASDLENPPLQNKVEKISNNDTHQDEITQYQPITVVDVTRQFVSCDDMEIIRIPSLTDFIEDYNPYQQESNDEDKNQDWIFIDSKSKPTE